MKNQALVFKKAVKFNDLDVPVYEIEGDFYLAGRDLGQILGFENPVDSIRVLFNRHKDDLEPCTTRIEVIRPSSPVDGRGGGPQNVRLYSETGCYLVTMFASTDRSKEVRRWLARLPKQHRQIKEYLPEMVEQIRQEAEARGIQKGYCLATNILAGKLDGDILAWVRWYRRQGLTHEETGLCLNITKFKAQEFQRRLEDMGFKFGKVTMQGRRRKVRDEFARELAQLTARQSASQEGRRAGTPALPSPEQDS